MRKTNNKNRIGEENYNTNGTLMKIIEYNGWKDVVVEFQDDYKYQTRVIYTNFKNGQVKNLYDKEIFGIGFIGKGIYNHQKDKKAYNVWRSMLQRCYDPYYINQFPTYKDCIVIEGWHNFQNFAKWFYDNYYEISNEKMCLDKDILYKGNKIYSPNTCCFVPNKINMLFVTNKNKRGNLPVGVSQKCKAGGYQCTCSTINGNIIYLSTFKNIRSAWLMYKMNKELIIQSVADEYKDLIPKKLYLAMYNYKVEISD